MTDKHKGFLLIDILISVALLAFLIVPMVLFIMQKQSINRYVTETERQIEPFYPSSDSDVYFDLEQLNSFSSRKSCDLFLSRNDPSRLKISSFDLLNHPRNVPSTIDVRSNGTSVFMYIGTNSASTTDSDLYVYKDLGNEFTIATNTSRFEKIQEINLGPGAIDSSLSERKLYVAERSTVTPLWYATIDPLLNTINGPVSLPPTLIQRTFPKIIESYGDMIYVGSEKSTQPEFYGVFQSGASNAPMFQKVFSAEINAGVNDIQVHDNNLIVASPKDPEIDLFSMQSIKRSLEGFKVAGLPSILNPNYSYDAEGSSGNGKSLFSHLRYLFIGRTIGNKELLVAKSLRKDSTSTNESIFEILSQLNPNKSVIGIQPILNNQYVMVFTNNPESSLMIYKKEDQYTLVSKISTTAPVVDYDCSSDKLYMISQSTSSSLNIISVEN